MKWKRNYKGDIETKDYMVMTFVLVDDEYYGEYGMADYPDEIATDEYKIRICSWHDDIYRKGCRVADTFSDIRLEAIFKTREEANKIWLWLKHKNPTIDEIKKTGLFKKSMW
jgi:hypothetical protein